MPSLTKCRYYDDDGQEAVRGGCARGIRRGPMHSGPRRGFSGAKANNPLVGDRIASSRWGLPPSPKPSGNSPIVTPQEETDPWNTASWTTSVDDTSKSAAPQPSPSRSTFGDKKGKGKSMSGWDALRASNDENQSDGWGKNPGSGGWGSSGNNGGWGNSGGDDGGWGSSSSADNGGWGSIGDRGSAETKKDEAKEDNTELIRAQTSFTTPTSTIPKSEKPVVPAIRIPSGLSRRESSPQIGSTTPASSVGRSSASVSKPRLPIPGHSNGNLSRQSSDRDKTPVAAIKSFTTKSRSTTPLQRAHSPRERKMGYETAVEKMINIAEMRTELLDAKNTLNRWKALQLSHQFGRARVSGRRKLDQIRIDLTEMTKGLEKAIAEEVHILTHEVPSVSSSSPQLDFDIEHKCEIVKSYIAEVDAYVEDLKRYREEAKANETVLELQKQQEVEAAQARAEMPPPPPPEDSKNMKWKELEARAAKVAANLEELVGVIDENRDYTALERIVDTADSRLQQRVRPVRATVEEERERLAVLTKRFEERAEVLKKLEERRAEMIKTKRDLESCVVKLEQWDRERGVLIAQLNDQVTNLHTLRKPESEPTPDYELFLPHVRTLTDQLIEELVAPAFARLSVECDRHAEHMHAEAERKIDAKMKEITDLTNIILELARAEAVTQRGQ
ncbi:hypothetical protein Moror_16444 [Moniliophthora roreri MCA 2997]|uniref:Uncharacterized protein n=1 Tax=Moniliophthora roreri (strain MCA 2997) TaxID=1381753 RepID=V2WVP7_MONRO|nr:hypothetical protein Moror_16444 [Moniliophthora roreri MCA 2997]